MTLTEAEIYLNWHISVTFNNKNIKFILNYTLWNKHCTSEGLQYFQEICRPNTIVNQKIYSQLRYKFHSMISMEVLSVIVCITVPGYKNTNSEQQ
jgi:hypothetical protein